MSVLMDDPFLFWNPVLSFVPDFPALTGVIDHTAGVLDISQHFQNPLMRPERFFVRLIFSSDTLIFKRCRNAFRIQFSCHLAAGLACEDVYKRQTNILVLAACLFYLLFRGAIIWQAPAAFFGIMVLSMLLFPRIPESGPMSLV